MTWFIQPVRGDDPAWDRLPAVAAAQGHRVVMATIRESFRGVDFDAVPNDQPAVAYGTIAFVRCVQRRRPDLVPGVWCDWNALSCRGYYPRWGDYLLQQVYCMLPFGDLGRRQDWLFNAVGLGGRLFVRPDANGKEFAGELLTEDSFGPWFRATAAPSDLLCVVSRPQKISGEYRVFLANGRAVTTTRYLLDGELSPAPDAPDDVLAFAERMAATWSPHPAFTLDVAVTPDGPRVLECGSVNCAGLYEADLEALVGAVSTAAEAVWTVKLADEV